MSHAKVLDDHILAIIQNEKISEQTELQSRLKKRGLKIPQATLSRHLKKLNIAKVAGIYKAIDFTMPHLPQVLDLRVSEFGLIVLHTHPGHANSLASYLDQKYVIHAESGLLGTLAGDDTILLITQSKHALKKVLGLLYDAFPYLQ